ncbi:MAG: hypothetical protein AAF740_11890, partial [Bacteroidota bacterium]
MSSPLFYVRFFVLVLLFSGFRMIGYSQAYLIDSLKTVLQTNPPQDDDDYLWVLNQISFYYAFIQPDSGVKYSRIFLSESKARSDEANQARAWKNLGGNYDFLGEFDSSIIAYQEALARFQNLELLGDVASVYSSISSVYHNNNRLYYDKFL